MFAIKFWLNPEEGYYRDFVDGAWNFNIHNSISQILCLENIFFFQLCIFWYLIIFTLKKSVCFAQLPSSLPSEVDGNLHALSVEWKTFWQIMSLIKELGNWNVNKMTKKHYLILNKFSVYSPTGCKYMKSLEIKLWKN
jgi:hypothetical protein